MSLVSGVAAAAAVMLLRPAPAAATWQDEWVLLGLYSDHIPEHMYDANNPASPLHNGTHYQVFGWSGTTMFVNSIGYPTCNGCTFVNGAPMSTYDAIRFGVYDKQRQYNSVALFFGGHGGVPSKFMGTNQDSHWNRMTFAHDVAVANGQSPLDMRIPGDGMWASAKVTRDGSPFDGNGSYWSLWRYGLPDTAHRENATACNTGCSRAGYSYGEYTSSSSSCTCRYSRADVGCLGGC